MLSGYAELLAELDDALADTDSRAHGESHGIRAARQPVHTVYVPADRVVPGQSAAWGGQALQALERHAPTAEALAAATGLDPRLVAECHSRIRAKLGTDPIEDLRIDLEDGYGVRGDDAEDRHAREAAAGVGRDIDAGTAPAYLGVRVKGMEAGERRRGLRSLAVFLERLLADRPLPPGFLITWPKVTSVAQVAAMGRACAWVEDALGLAERTLRFELQVEAPLAVLDSGGTAPLARMVQAGEGRVWALHFGTYDYTAACGVTAAQQSMDHPAADHAKAVMQLAAVATGVWLSDGSSNLLPVGDTPAVLHAWREHCRLVRRSLDRGFYQGWDLHPHQLPSRYLATYAFYRQALPAAAARLRDYADAAGGSVLDEPATAQALATTLVRGLDCGALDEAETHDASGVDTDRLRALAARRVG